MMDPARPLGPGLGYHEETTGYLGSTGNLCIAAVRGWLFWRQRHLAFSSRERQRTDEHCDARAWLGDDSLRRVALHRMPIASQVGLSQLHYGILLVIAMGIGIFIPPIGIGFYVCCAVCETTSVAVSPCSLHAASSRPWPLDSWESSAPYSVR